MWGMQSCLKAGAISVAAGAVFFLAQSAASAQTGGGGSLATLGGGTTGATGAGATGGGGSSGGLSTLQTSNAFTNQGSAFTSLGPSQNIGPVISIGGQAIPVRGGGGSVPQIPSTSNPFGPYYYNALQYGINTVGSGAGSASNVASMFGQPLYPLATTNTTNAAGAAGLTMGQAMGFSSYGRSRTPAYYAVLSDDFPVTEYPPSKLENELRGILARTSTLKGQNIKVQVIGDGRVLLQGQVTDERAKERAEAQVSITPGVDEVINRLNVVGTARSGPQLIQRASN